jgi:hypothetical protein
LHFLPTESRVALVDLGNFVDTKMSRIKQDSSIETIRFRQAVYINWTKTMLIPDPCGREPGYEFIVTCFLEQLMNSHNSRADTVCGYVKAVNILFELRYLEIPGDTSDKENLCSKIIHARERDEDIAKQRSPITTEMFAAMADEAISSKEDSIDSVIFDWFCFIRITGLRVAEYAQRYQTKVDVHEYPSGKRVTKAFIASDWKFYDKKGKIVDVSCPTSKPTKVKVTFRIKKIDGMGNQSPSLPMTAIQKYA